MLLPANDNAPRSLFVTPDSHNGLMCLMCAGASLDEVRFSIHGAIERHGWAIVAVGTRFDRDPPWAYTIGLSAGYGHPELVIVGPVGPAPDVLNHLGAAVRDGERFHPACPEIDVQGLRARIGDVHRDEWMTGRFAAWVDYYGALGPPRPAPAAVQVIWHDERGRFPPEPGFDKACPRKGDCQPLLDRAGGTPPPRTRQRPCSPRRPGGRHRRH